jgi:hypothetical protein
MSLERQATLKASLTATFKCVSPILSNLEWERVWRMFGTRLQARAAWASRPSACLCAARMAHTSRTVGTAIQLRVGYATDGKGLFCMATFVACLVRYGTGCLACIGIEHGGICWVQCCCANVSVSLFSPATCLAYTTGRANDRAVPTGELVVGRRLGLCCQPLRYWQHMKAAHRNDTI